MKQWSMYLFILICGCCFQLAVSAENWPQWRGPDFNGAANAKNLPHTWSQTDNMRWIANLPGESAATPIIWGDKIFVASRDERSGDLLGLCINAKTGTELWRQTLGIDPGGNRRQNMASPSPATDGKHVVFLFGSGDLAVLDLDGKILWQRNLVKEMGRFSVQFGYASSPLLYKDKLYITILQRNPASFLIAIDPATGKDIFKEERPSDAKAESLEAYTTPIPLTTNGREEIVLFGADYATGHDPETGKEIWRWGEYNPRKVGHWRIVPSPVAGGGMIYVAAPKREPLFALKAGATGTVGDEQIAWQFKDAPPDVCTSAYHDGHLYVLDGDRHVITKLNAKTGETIWKGDLDSDVVMRASPTIADGKIFAHNESGRFYVMEDGDEFKLLSQIEMGKAPIRSSFAFGDDYFLIRTAERLYCVATQ
ncbi:MAG: PQQ-binding-like beta-propeller repeat protein [Candidatus Hinthialibacter antarcticus]|nr:PQQ-binding-like beta-propeller repeat protein [Candidatus Hinthialibacter antarcticus]